MIGETGSLDFEFTQSQASKVYAFNICKLERPNYLLSASNVSPLKQLQSKLGDSCDLQKHRYRLKPEECIETAFDTICPGEGQGFSFFFMAVNHGCCQNS